MKMLRETDFVARIEAGYYTVHKRNGDRYWIREVSEDFGVKRKLWHIGVITEAWVLAPPCDAADTLKQAISMVKCM